MKTFKNNFIVALYVIKHAPLYAFSTLLSIVSSVLLTYSNLVFVEEVTAAIESSNPDLIIRICLIYALLLFLLISVNNIHWRWLRPRGRLSFVKKMQRLMYEKAQLLDVEYFDDPEKYDQFSRAIKDSDIKGVDSYDALVDLVRGLAGMLTVSFYIIFKLPLLFVMIFVASIITFLIYQQYNKLRYKKRKELETINRYNEYINRVFYLEKYTTDVKTTVLPSLLLDKLHVLYEQEKKSWRKNEWQRFGLQVFEEVIYEIATVVLTYGYIMYQLIKGKLSIANLLPTTNAVMNLIGSFYGLSRNIVLINDHALYIEDFLWLLKYRPRLENSGGAPVEAMHPAIKIDNISFSYPNQEVKALSNINLTINPCAKVAIIGYNGAGKSTLSKLLLKFYLPDEGHIYLDDDDYQDLATEAIREKYTITLQNFQIYAVTVLENIFMRKKSSATDETMAWEILAKVGLKEKIAACPDGLNTILTKEFTNNGLELSGGERQRLAIARILGSDAPIIVLDEPTASLDPYGEKQINEIILSESKNRTVIIISHRLSTIVDVDEIHLMREGRIVESGTHAQLMNLKGEYYEMFLAQAKYYQNDAKDNFQKINDSLIKH